MQTYFTYTGIRVSNLTKSLDFYKKVMGMKVILRGKMKHGGIYFHLRSPKSAQRLELNWYPRDNQYYTKYVRGEELDHLAFWCENVSVDFAALVKRGAIPMIHPFREGTYELVFVKDPDEIWIELLGKAKMQPGFKRGKSRLCPLLSDNGVVALHGFKLSNKTLGIVHVDIHQS